MLAWWMWGWAVAGTGPWVPGSQQGSLYLGVDAQEYRTIAATVDGERTKSELGEGQTELHAAAILSYGIAPRLELETTVPFHWVEFRQAEGEPCLSLGDGACDRTRTLGAPRFQLKFLIADELSGAPLSIAASGVVRIGQPVASFRSRLTNVGEGTLDGGGRLSLGKGGNIAETIWSTSLDAQFLARMPSTRSFPLGTSERVVPGSEWSGSGEFLWGPSPVWSIGPSLNFLWRPSGVDFDELVVADPNRFAAFRVAQLNVGGKFIVRDNQNNAFVIGFHQAAYALNNPIDQFGVSVGVSLNNLFRERS